MGRSSTQRALTWVKKCQILTFSILTISPQGKISLHDFHPPPVVDDDQDDGDEGDDEDGDDHRGGGGGGGVGGGGGEGRQLDRPVDHLQR